MFLLLESALGARGRDLTLVTQCAFRGRISIHQPTPRGIHRLAQTKQGQEDELDIKLFRIFYVLKGNQDKYEFVIRR